jgi:SagB-type dehydrogenase family enzyme
MYFTFERSCQRESTWLVSLPTLGRQFEISSADLRRLVKQPSALATLVGGPERVIVDLDEAVTRRAALKWAESGWLPSLNYFLWSRAVSYLDLRDSTRSTRRKTLDVYRTSGSLPARASHGSVRISLPRAGASFVRATSLGSVLAGRRTRRRFNRQPVSLDAFSATLSLGLGSVAAARSAAASSKDMPELISFGVAFDFFVVAFNVEDLTGGVYAYIPESHEVSLLQEGDFRAQVTEIIAKQKPPMTAAFTVFLVVDYQQAIWRYRHERALRNIYIEAGRIVQRLIWGAESVGLGCFPTPAISDSKAANLLKIADRGRWNAIYSLTVGPSR